MGDASATPASLTRNELYELVWSEPMKKVAPRFGLSDVGLAKLCKRNDIPRPPVGYWAQRQFGKQPERTLLPPADDGLLKTIEFSIEEKAKPALMLTAADRVTDEQLKKLIQFEEQPENQIVINEDPVKFHPFVRATRASLKETTWHRQGLHSPSWGKDEARLDIEVGKETLPRSFRLMDALIKAFEKRGHKVVAEAKEYRKDVLFVILGEQFSFRLREKTKMVRIPESERNKDIFSNRVKYEPTGNLELQLRRKQWGYSEVTWKDGKRSKLEDQLNDVMIELIVAVEKERNWRRQQEDNERQRREDEAKRWRQEQERRKDEQKVNELNQMVQNWDQAIRIREFMSDVRSTIELRRGPIEVGSDLAQWIEWALKHADKLDPLRAERTDQAAVPTNNGWLRPHQPR